MARDGTALGIGEAFRMDAAESAALEVLVRDPGHFGALTALGCLAQARGDAVLARAFYTKAAVEHPTEPQAHVNLGNVLAAADELDAARACFAQALALQPGHPGAHFALSLLEHALGNSGAALRHRQLAFARPEIRVTAFAGSGDPLRVLLLLAANGGNVVTQLLLDDRSVELYTLVAEGYRPELELPPHHLLFNGIGDADRSADALRIAASIAARSPAPVINTPAAVLATGRAAVSARLGALAGVVAPRTASFARAALDAGALTPAGFAFPLLIRAPGFHTGEHFELVAEPAALPAACERLPGETLFAIAFHDVRGPDGAFRKYRMMCIGGRLYPLHLAIARQWKVHYFSADMAGNAAHQAEEAAFLAAPEAHLGATTIATLERIATLLALDYGGIDFGLDPAGNVVVFEANATMAIFPPDPAPEFAYRRAPIERALAAVHDLLVATAARSD